MLEATIVMPVAISLMAGGIEFGNLLSSYGTAAKSVRNAARYLARVPEGTVCTSGQTVATNLALYGNASGTGTALLPPLTTTITFPDPCPSTSVTVQAVILYTPLMFTGIPFTSIQFGGWPVTVTHTEPYIGVVLLL